VKAWTLSLGVFLAIACSSSTVTDGQREFETPGLPAITPFVASGNDTDQLDTPQTDLELFEAASAALAAIESGSIDTVFTASTKSNDHESTIVMRVESEFNSSGDSQGTSRSQFMEILEGLTTPAGFGNTGLWREVAGDSFQFQHNRELWRLMPAGDDPTGLVAVMRLGMRKLPSIRPDTVVATIVHDGLSEYQIDAGIDRENGGGSITLVYGVNTNKIRTLKITSSSRRAFFAGAPDENEAGDSFEGEFVQEFVTHSSDIVVEVPSPLDGPSQRELEFRPPK
jgi:hypothetical protein